MKILFVYLFCTRGGVETAIKNRLQCISKYENQIDLLFFNDFGGKSIYDDTDLNIIIQNDMVQIGSMIKEKAYDFIISIDTFEILTVLKKMHYKGKIGLEVHTTYSDSLMYLKNINRNEITYISVPSNYQKGLVTNYIKEDIPIHIIPNSLDNNDFHPVNLEKKSERPILLWIGRLDTHKNWKSFLEIAHEIKKSSHNSFDFFVVGGLKSEESEIRKFNKMIFELELHDVLRWIPFCEYKKMANVYNYVAQSGGAYLITSANESFGMTAIEAMACNCPVIVNNVGALGEIVNDKTGLVININQGSKEIAQIILKYLRNSYCKKINTNNALEYINSNFTNLIVGNKFMDILRKYN